MKKTKFEKIKKQQKKARNKEITYRIDKLFKYGADEAVEILKDVVEQLHIFGYLHPKDMEKHLLPGYKIIETTTDKEENKNE